ncbi:MAG TPA: acyl-CoA dehydrogenase family protein [Geminicoccaceae bacterium]|nr:acyl-CoA dehydrogenase family protein [Geminicoccus sp.]HMU51012.1 acyl-CoA dehydrogenase family protein [Geminicoccaceae bacterium]
MTSYVPPLADIRFVLDRVARLDEVTGLPGLEHATPDLTEAILEAAGQLAAEVLAPLNATGDRQGSVLENGVVRTPEGFREAYRRFVEGGWNGLVFPERWGGQGLPWTLNAAASEMWHGANLAFQLWPLLTQAAIEALLHHGSEAQQALYLPKLVSGEWTGAMCLTEPQAGTDVGALRSRAEPDGDAYRIHGQKIFITYGDHDLAENVVHLVLARLPGAPPGTKGISLFLVPKLLPDTEGRPGRRNDMRVLKLEHKLGIHASPTCVMAYGEDEGAVGWLIGEPHGGMRCMFTMMNNARLAVGLEGLGIAERAHQQALAYARERVQGRIDGRPARLVDFPDVRRMLLTMRAQIAAMRALSYVAAAAVDRSQRHSSAEEREAAAGRVALLTPICKAWCTDVACEVASLAVQVHGGMGFIEETGAAQHYRDARITPIYEGANGIQALDLAGRKLTMEDGRLPWRLFAELRDELPGLPDGEMLRKALGTLEGATEAMQRDPAAAQAAATPYLRLFASVLAAFLLARGAAAAGGSVGADWPQLSRFYNRHLLPPALGLAEVVSAGAEDLQLDA